MSADIKVNKKKRKRPRDTNMQKEPDRQTETASDN